VETETTRDEPLFHTRSEYFDTVRYGPVRRYASVPSGRRYEVAPRQCRHSASSKPANSAACSQDPPETVKPQDYPSPSQRFTLQTEHDRLRKAAPSCDRHAFPPTGLFTPAWPGQLHIQFHNELTAAQDNIESCCRVSGGSPSLPCQAEQPLTEPLSQNICLVSQVLRLWISKRV
jgi:hypothetical protein